MAQFSNIRKNPIQSLKDFKIVYNLPLVNELKSWNYNNHFFSYFRQDATQLVVMLQGAVNREKVKIPVFQRWSWFANINASILILNDPTLFGNSLELGWWQGEEEKYALPSACRLVELVAKKLGISTKEVVFFGSSAGGFSALMMAGHLRRSFVIANNPQTNILEYEASHIHPLLKTKFRGISKQEAFERYPNRFSVLEFFKSINYVPKIAYYQNIKDHTHFETQYLPFIQDLYQSELDPNELQSILYTHDRGHYPLEKLKTVEIINYWLRRLPELEKLIPLNEIPLTSESANVPIPLE